MTEAFPGLTPRQQDVLGGLVIGLSNKAIARELGIAEGTVKQHVHAIYRELGVDSRTEAVYLLARRGVRFV
jgi:two-component system nitrate/nitrite response regulator NarL